MSLTVTAEGVETETQKNFLHNAGCNEMQGYLFSKPIPEKQVTRMLSRASSNALQPCGRLPVFKAGRVRVMANRCSRDGTSIGRITHSVPWHPQGVVYLFGLANLRNLYLLERLSA